ncbi:MAG: response regulator [Cyanobacteria bacterium P01_H01_bin.15]
MATHKILVIDDSKVIRMRVKEMLPEGNFEVVEAKDGLEGFNLICQENPNLIMLDFLLPKMSGWEVYQEIQKQGKLKAIPLLLMSGRKEEVTEKVQEPFENFAFVEKPFDQKQLIDGIRDAMQKARKFQRQLEKTSLPGVSSAAGDADIAALQAKVVTLEKELNTLKKQFVQLLKFVKHKMS